MRAIVGFAVVVGCSSTAKPTEPIAVPAAASNADKLAVVALPTPMVDGMTAALKFVAATERYGLVGVPAVFQNVDVPKGERTGVRVYVVDGPPAKLPELCMLTKTVVELCAGDRCDEIDGRSHPLVLCNARSMQTLDTLFRLEHAVEEWQRRNRSDAAFTQVITAAETDPAKILDELRPTVTDAHLTDHWVFFSAFLFHHAMQHWLDTSATTTFDGPEREGPLDADACAAYEAYERRTDAIPIWGAELRADAAATTAVLEIIALIGKTDAAYAATLDEEVISDLGLLARWQWFRRLDRFLAATCPAAVGSRFAMSRCLCSSREHWARASAHLLSPTQPPLVLRATTLVMPVIQGRATPPGRRMVAEFLYLESFHDAALKIARAVCAPTSSVAPLDLPALEGETTLGGQPHLLWPTVQDRSQLAAQCAAP